MTIKKRRISGAVSRRMRLLHFGEFRDLLLRQCTGPRQKAELFEGVDESFTSMCCGKCGHPNKALGASKVFRCLQPNCGNVECRDGGAARKILIKFLLQPTLISPPYLQVATVQVAFFLLTDWQAVACVVL